MKCLALLPGALVAALIAALGSCGLLLPATRAERPAAGRVAPEGIYRAAAAGDIAALKAALSEDPGLLDARDKGGWTAASHAAWARQKPAYDYLVARGAATTVYSEAALGPLPALVERLEASPAVVGSRDPVQKATPLHWAVRTGNLLACELLLGRGAEVDAPDGTGRTPLHYAAGAGDAQTAEFLLQAGAHPAAADIKGRGALHLAVEAGDFEMIVLLLAAGAPVDAGDRQGDTSLHLAAARGDFELCEYLLAVGAQPALRNAAGRTPLELARQGGHDRVVSLLEQRAPR
jgi:ankyrin repeat protein